MRIKRLLVGGLLAVLLGVAAAGVARQAEAAPPFRTVLDLGPGQMREGRYHGFGLLGQGEICTTYFVDGAQAPRSVVGATPGYSGYVVAIVVDTRGQVVANLEFRGTECKQLAIPSGSYFLQAIRGSGIFRMEVYDLLGS